MPKAWIIEAISIRSYYSLTMNKTISTDLSPANLAKVIEILTETLQDDTFGVANQCLRYYRDLPQSSEFLTIDRLTE